MQLVPQPIHRALLELRASGMFCVGLVADTHTVFLGVLVLPPGLSQTQGLLPSDAEA